MTNTDYIGKSVEEQMLDNRSSYLHCSMCGCKIDDLSGETAAEEIDGYMYCGIQSSYSNGCKYRVKIQKMNDALKEARNGVPVLQR